LGLDFIVIFRFFIQLRFLGFVILIILMYTIHVFWVLICGFHNSGHYLN
jgi:hypothetical protein